MSKHEYSYIGYGISLYNKAFKDLTLENVKELAKYCTPYSQEVINECDCIDDIDNLEFISFGYTGGIGAMIVEAISVTEEIQLVNAVTECDHCILYEATYPWHLKNNDREKNLSLEELNNIFIKYQKILGIKESDIQTPTYWDIIGYC